MSGGVARCARFDTLDTKETDSGKLALTTSRSSKAVLPHKANTLKFRANHYSIDQRLGREVAFSVIHGGIRQRELSIRNSMSFIDLGKQQTVQEELLEL